MEGNIYSSIQIFDGCYFSTCKIGQMNRKILFTGTLPDQTGFNKSIQRLFESTSSNPYLQPVFQSIFQSQMNNAVIKAVELINAFIQLTENGERSGNSSCCFFRVSTECPLIIPCRVKSFVNIVCSC